MKGKLLHYRSDCIVGKVYDLELDGSFYTFTDEVGSLHVANPTYFELVEDVKPAPLIDGPGVYRTRGGEEVSITKLRTGEELKVYHKHVWEDAIGDCYRPDGGWNQNPDVTSQFDIVEKISSTPENDPKPVEDRKDDQPLLRQFSSGATRNLDNNKYDYEGFLSPLVIEAFGKYMHSHRLQKDGKMRDSSNWKKGIPDEVYMKSMWRHFFDVWKLYSGYEVLSPEDGHSVDREEALCALMFNVQGYMHELLKEQSNG